MKVLIPKFSIITICFNDKAGLEKTLASVSRQVSKDYELIVIDGGSTDGSVEVIKQHKSIVTYWVSERDSGMYSAMNKGINKARGEYVLFLNSGDYLSSDYVLINLLHYTLNKPVYFGNLIVQDGDKNETWVVDFQGQVIDAGFFKKYALPHQATLFRRDVFEKYGVYNESYRLLGDHEYFMRLVKNGVEMVHIPVSVAVYNNVGRSTETKNKWVIQKEK